MRTRLYITLSLLGLLSLLTLLGLSFDWKNFNFFYRQLVFYILGFFLLFLLGRNVNIVFLKRNKYFVFLIYLLVVGLLVFVLLQPFKVRNVRGWIRLGSFYFQPSELAKFVLVLLLAKYFSKRHIEIWRWRHILISGGYFIILFLLVAIEPDLGNALILGFIWVSMILIAKVRLKQLIILSAIFFLLVSVAWIKFLQPYQKLRILSFINPEKQNPDARYQINQAKIAMGEGGVFGIGLGGGIQTKFHFLPQAHSDFIFATFFQYWGLIGVLILFFLYSTLFWILFRIIKDFTKPEMNFERLFIFGYASFLFVHIFIHIGGNLALLPVTGITLPFMSYGGSNLLINFLFLGIIDAIIHLE